MNESESRKENLKRLIENQFEGSQVKFADTVGMAPSYISQMINGYRNIGEKTARKIEAAANLPNGWLDHDNTRSITNGNALLTSSQARTLIETIQEMDAAGEMTPEELESLNTYLMSRRKTKEQFKSGAGAFIRKNAGQPPKSEGQD